MKFLYNTTLLNLVATLLFSVSLSAQSFTAKLTGAQEVPQVSTRAHGSVTAVLSGSNLVVTGDFDDLQTAFDPTVAGGSHIHSGYIGQAGGIELTLTPTLDGDLMGGDFLAANNTFTLTAAQVDLLNQRRLYVNIHTIGFGGGELRGQFAPSGATVYTIYMHGSHEVPSAITSAHGALMVEVDGSSMIATGSFADLEGDFDATIAGGAHLHNAPAGRNGGVEFLLDASVDANLRGGVFTAATNSFTLSAAQQSMIESRAIYSNIHTTKYAGGELRGQLTANPNSVWRAFLNGAQEVPVVTSSGNGELIVELDQNTLTVHGAFNDLDSDFDPTVAGGSHIHAAAAGRAGGVQVILDADVESSMRAGVYEPMNNMFNLSAGQVDTLFNRMMYVNLHTVGQAPGEIRGQIQADANNYYQSFLSGAFETPGILTEATGMLLAEVTGDMMTVYGAFDNLRGEFAFAVAGGSHIHAGFAGQSGAIVADLLADVESGNRAGAYAAAENMIQLTATQQEMLRERMFYSNIHTDYAPGGELRGQFMHEATAYFVSNLSGANEATPVNTDAFGGVAAELNGNVLAITGAFEGLSSSVDVSIAGGAHLHTGLAGQSGGVEFLVNADIDASGMAGVFASSDNTIEMTSGQLDTLKMRMHYLNIHSMTQAAGELRGQLLPLANQYLTLTASGWNEVQPVMSGGMGALIAEKVNDMVTVTGSFSNLEGMVDTAIAGGSHIHNAAAGENGAVSIILNIDFEAGMMAGAYTAANNMYSLDQTQMDAFMAEEMYLNIHSTVFASGELRGQFLSDANFYPETAELIAPLSGANLLIDTAATSMLDISWNASTDINDNMLTFTWQLSTDAQFADVLFQTNVAGDLMTSVMYSDIDSILAQQGLLPGDTVTLYHRVVASDGSLNNGGEPQNVTMQRDPALGLSTPENGTFISMFPNPAEDYLNIFTSGQPFDGTLVLYNELGQEITSRSIVQGDVSSSFKLNVSDLNPGVYWVKIQSQDENYRFTEAIVKK